jgi:hypothetical protein
MKYLKERFLVSAENSLLELKKEFFLNEMLKQLALQLYYMSVGKCLLPWVSIGYCYSI